MKVGIVVDGDLERETIGAICRKLDATWDTQLLPVVKAIITPTAPIATIARSCAAPIRQLFLRGADRVVVLIDLERDNRLCAVQLSRQLRSAIISTQPGFELPSEDALEVVVKRTTFENWLIADVEAVNGCSRLRLSRSAERTIIPGKADNVNALEMLKRSAVGMSYDKMRDGRTIAERVKPQAIAIHSRSFRRFLRVAGHPVYAGQSARHSD